MAPITPSSFHWVKLNWGTVIPHLACCSTLQHPSPYATNTVSATRCMAPITPGSFMWVKTGALIHHFAWCSNAFTSPLQHLSPYILQILYRPHFYKTPIAPTSVKQGLSRRNYFVWPLLSSTFLLVFKCRYGCHIWWQKQDLLVSFVCHPTWAPGIGWIDWI